ncbi:MAG TPA: patatin-like phospholipase family protein [Tepidiformaceae bacterium]|nr:patatin-like phospholipase family protein [Tepidiformaceae bacterium]
MDHASVVSLPHTPFLDALDARSRRMIAGESSVLDVRHGEIVIEAGHPVEMLYVVESGVLHAEVSDHEGNTLAVARFGKGDFFGEMSFLRNDVAAATVRAAADATLLAIPHTTLTTLAGNDPAIMRELAVVVARRLNTTNTELRRARVGRAVGCLVAPTPLAHALFQAVRRSLVDHLQGPVLEISLDDALTPQGAKPLATLEESLANRGLLESHDLFAAANSKSIAVVTNTATGRVDEVALSNLISDYEERYALVLVTALSTSPQALVLHSCTDERLHFHDPSAGTDILPGTPGDYSTVQVSETPVARKPEIVEPPPIRTIVGDLPTISGADTASETGRSVGWVARHILRRKVGVALGAGGSKGYAHIGVIDGLQKAGIPIDYIAGSSVGAPIAWAVARGMSTTNIHDVLHATFRRALRPTLPVKSLLTTRWIHQDLERFVNHTSFEDLRIPLAIVAVDAAKRSEVVFTSGDLVTAMLASTAIPGLFPPVRWRGRQLVDGGLLNPIPSTVVRGLGADVVIGVKLTNPVETDLRPVTSHRFMPPSPPIIDTVLAAIETLQWKIVHDGGAHADVTLEPEFHGPTGLHDYTRGDHFVDAGRDAVRACAGELKVLLPWSNP